MILRAVENHPKLPKWTRRFRWFTKMIQLSKAVDPIDRRRDGVKEDADHGIDEDRLDRRFDPKARVVVVTLTDGSL